ncbi:MAG: DUF411 domain-containing protein [Sulfuricella denitrificans]|nr:DUF411 domain-containing protein [Sulfuricella denitrificans]
MKFSKITAVLAGVILSHNALAAQFPAVDVYKSPYCGCCGKWVEHLRQNGFEVRTHNVADVQAERSRLGMPDRLAACHTAKIGKYVVEGHVPAQDIKHMLAAKPQALGLAVPSMPPGSPGMEGVRAIPYDTLLVQSDGTTRVFARH